MYIISLNLLITKHILFVLLFHCTEIVLSFVCNICVFICFRTEKQNQNYVKKTIQKNAIFDKELYV